jgi:hypothetical protein
MPKKGYKTITVKAEVYDYYHSTWQQRKKEYNIKGVNSFSAFISYVLNEALSCEK